MLRGPLWGVITASDQAHLWLKRAEELRAVATTFRDATAKKDLLQSADTWERMAKDLEDRAKRRAFVDRMRSKDPIP
jgi:hypothetical protein